MTLESLKPVRKDLVFDLVQEAGFDVTDWKSSARNTPIRANPKYCYEWAFVEPGKVVILNLWYDVFEEQDDVVIQRNNFREDARLNLGKPTWFNRATRLDQAVKTAFRDKLPVRVIINDGVKRRKGDPTSRPSRVTARQLDPEIWAITHYNLDTGANVIARGVVAPKFVDQFDLAETVEAEAKKREVSGFAFERDRAVRHAVLARANGKCEYCGDPGFKMANGGIYLETHHVVPLCEGGKDGVRNVVALCPNDHRRAHYAAQRDRIRLELLARTI